jgi:hypothetical protein
MRLLTEAELLRFKTDGFVLLYNILDPELLHQARERVCVHLLPHTHTAAALHV